VNRIRLNIGKSLSRITRISSSSCFSVGRIRESFNGKLIIGPPVGSESQTFNPWIALSFDAAQLGWEAQNVIVLRLVRLAAGRIGVTETGLMITEKIAATGEAQAVVTAFVLEGRNGHTAATKIIDVYRKRVHANKRLLATPSR
jgi:hypothetical protein